MTNPHLELLREPEIAEAQLAEYLAHGHLTLLLGAGVSAGLGLPQWDDLVQGAEVSAGLDPGPAGDNALGYMQRMDAMRLKLDNKDAYHALVRRELYGPARIAAGTYDSSIATSRMMSALGALSMSSARGSVGDVFTLNFDDALDWYLHLHGFRTQVIAEVPVLNDGDVDVRIHHFHGFLPLNPIYTRSQDILFTENELVERLAEEASFPWPATLGAMLLSKVLLIVGTSMGDLDVKQILAKTRKQLNGTRPVGFAIGAKIPDLKAKALLEQTVVPIDLDSLDEIPEFLLRICQRAAAIRAR